MTGASAPVSHLGAALSQLGLSARDLWIGYFAIGGNASLAEVKGWLDGTAEPDDMDHDLIAHAMNEEFADRDLNHPLGYRLNP